MNTFVNNTNNPRATVTQNGAVAFTHVANSIVDLFYAIGSARNSNTIQAIFSKAFVADKTLAARTLFWARDVRGGAGERSTFRKLMIQLEQTDPASLVKLLPFVPEYGRWDDLLIFNTTRIRNEAYKIYALGIRSGDGLAAKWAPRKGPIAVELRNFMGLSPKQYRKTIVNLSNTVEQKMCAQEWDKIEFGKLPSIAAKRYMQAFLKNAKTQYAQYIEGLKKGTEKINASAIFPHDVIVGMKYGDVEVGVAQWNALPNYLSDKKILPMVDVSGSMTCSAGGNVSCLDVAVALGLYVADKQPGAYNGMFLTFSESPQLIKLEGTLPQKMGQMRKSNWGMNTNITAAFDLVLSHAKQYKVSQADMPQYLLIMSDMQFDQCGRISGLDMMRQKYEQAGYQLPVIVFWNLNAVYSNVPVSTNDKGVVMISGFSPAIMKSVLSVDLESITPLQIVLNTINSERYQLINLVD